MGEQNMTVTTLHPNKDPNAILARNKDSFESVFIVGWDNNSILRIDATDNWGPADILWVLEKAKQHILSFGDVYEDE
jgi:hypothetical protein